MRGWSTGISAHKNINPCMQDPNGIVAVSISHRKWLKIYLEDPCLLHEQEGVVFLALNITKM